MLLSRSKNRCSTFAIGSSDSIRRVVFGSSFSHLKISPGFFLVPGPVFYPNPTAPKNYHSRRFQHPGFKSNFQHLCGVLVDVQKREFFDSLPRILIYIYIYKSIYIQIYIYIYIHLHRIPKMATGLSSSVFPV